uniref:Uncharacterized protein n=1 Tax=Arundo donax TaxID=35708 RepID=A0A0A8ZFH5_ARUDO
MLSDQSTLQFSHHCTQTEQPWSFPCLHGQPLQQP